MRASVVCAIFVVVLPVPLHADLCDAVDGKVCNGQDIQGGNVGVVSNAAECCAKCQATAGCKAWTWNKVLGQHCYVKTGCDKPSYDVPHRRVSGSIDGPSPSPPTPPAPTPPTPPGPTPPTPPGKHDFSYYDAVGQYKVATKALGVGGAEVWYPTASPPAGGWPVYQFVCGTGARPANYIPTLQHIASHGFVAVANTMTSQASEAVFKLVLGGKLPAPVNPAKVAAGGHSGGGPLACFLAGNHADKGMHYVGQHAAAVPFINAPSKAQLAKVKGKVLQICGTRDIMPFCGCGNAQNDYFTKYPASTSRALLKAPDTHNGGTQGASGDKAEGGYIVAFLSYVLKGDTGAHAALKAGAQRSGYSITDNFVADPDVIAV